MVMVAMVMAAAVVVGADYMAGIEVVCLTLRLGCNVAAHEIRLN